MIGEKPQKWKIWKYAIMLCGSPTKYYSCKLWIQLCKTRFEKSNLSKSWNHTFQLAAWPLKIKFELYAFDLTSQTLQVNFMGLFIKKASWKSWMVEIKIFFVSQLNLRLDTKIINFHFALECIAMKLYKKRISTGIDVQLKLFWSWLLYKPGFIDEWPLF